MPRASANIPLWDSSLPDNRSVDPTASELPTQQATTSALTIDFMMGARER